MESINGQVVKSWSVERILEIPCYIVEHGENEWTVYGLNWEAVESGISRKGVIDKLIKQSIGNQALIEILKGIRDRLPTDKDKEVIDKVLNILEG